MCSAAFKILLPTASVTVVLSCGVSQMAAERSLDTALKTPFLAQDLPQDWDF
jgi:hypothetical protein